MSARERIYTMTKADKDSNVDFNEQYYIDLWISETGCVDPPDRYTRTILDTYGARLLERKGVVRKNHGRRAIEELWHIHPDPRAIAISIAIGVAYDAKSIRYIAKVLRDRFTRSATAKQAEAIKSGQPKGEDPPSPTIIPPQPGTSEMGCFITRRIRNHPILCNAPVWLRLFWFDLMIEASPWPEEIELNGSKYKLNRGDVLVPLKEWIERYEISAREMRDWLKVLRSQGMISYRVIKNGESNKASALIISLTNYAKYQDLMLQILPVQHAGRNEPDNQGKNPRENFHVKNLTHVPPHDGSDQKIPPKNGPSFPSFASPSFPPDPPITSLHNHPNHPDKIPPLTGYSYIKYISTGDCAGADDGSSCEKEKSKGGSSEGGKSIFPPSRLLRLLPPVTESGSNSRVRCHQRDEEEDRGGTLGGFPLDTPPPPVFTEGALGAPLPDLPPALCSDHRTSTETTATKPRAKSASRLLTAQDVVDAWNQALPSFPQASLDTGYEQRSVAMLTSYLNTQKNPRGTLDKLLASVLNSHPDHASKMRIEYLRTPNRVQRLLGGYYERAKSRNGSWFSRKGSPDEFKRR